jgi:hypothetical protein
MAELKYLAHINLNENQLQNAAMQILSSDPSGFEGHLYYNSSSNVLKFHNGTEYVSLSSASGDITGVTAGNGLTGGGSSGAVTLTAGAGTGITVNTNDIAVTAAQTGITSVLNASLVAGRDADNQIKFSTDDQIIFRVGGGDGVTFKASGEIEATSLDISGDVDVDGTLEADAITVGGTALNTVIAGVTVSNATTAAVATTVTITDNESTNENNPLVFVAGGDLDGGNLGLESDGTTHYNPSTGTITATAFAGNLTGNVTGNVSGSAGSATGNAATATALETARNIGGVSFDGTANINLPGVNTSGSQDTSGNAATATALETARAFTTSGDVVLASANFDGSGNFTTTATIQANAVEGSMLNNNVISGQTDIGAAIASTDEILISDAGTLRRSDVSRLTTFLQSALTFTTNTDVDVSVANLKSKLADGFASNAVTIGDSDDVVTIGHDLVVTNDVTVSGDLNVTGDTITTNTTTISVKDPIISLGNNNAADVIDLGIYGRYVESSTVKFAGIFRDADADGDAWTFFDGLQAEPGTTVNTSGTGYDLADISAGTIRSADGFIGNITGNVTGNTSGSSGSCTGNAATATKLATARTINGTSFDGTGNITLGNDSVTNAMMADDAIDTAQLADSAVNTARIAADAVTGAKIADDAIDSEHYTDGSIDTAHIGDDQVTYAKIQNVSATNRILGRDSSGAGVIEEITPANLRTMINVEDGATADQSKSDIDGLAITTVGTLDTGDATAIVSAASTSAAGKVELATTAEALAGSDSSRAVTPAGLAARSFTATIGDGSDDDIAITHSLGTRNVIVQMYDASSYETVIAEVVRTDANTVTINTNAGSTIASNDIIVLIQKID